MAALSVIQVVLAAARADGRVRSAAGPDAVFRPAAATLYQVPSRDRSLLCRRSVRWGAAGFLHPIFRRATGWDAFVQLCCADGRRVMDYNHGNRDAVHSKGQRFAAPELDDAQL